RKRRVCRGRRRRHRGQVRRAGEDLAARRQGQNQMARHRTSAQDVRTRLSRLRGIHRGMKADSEAVDLRSEDAVMQYLRDNPDFFGRHPMLLTDLSLPHDTGQAISLVERQVAILRERNIDMRRRLNHLVGAANTNDTLYEKTRRFTLEMLDCND